MFRGHTSAGAAVLDAAIPASLAFTSGAIDWLTPDQAAMDALAQATHTDITNAFDLHKTLAEHQYHLLTEGSLTNWSGHVGEAQVAEQIESWAPAGTVTMPDASNYAGADISFFDGDFQVKFYSDFNDINNIHGDSLIVNEDAANIPSDALHIDFSEPFDPSILDGHDVIVAEGLTLAGADDAWESAAGLWAGGLDGGDAIDAAGDAFIPGIGSAIRVGMSGYRRRSALQDPALRERAMGRVARDGAYGLAGAGGGALLGGLIGGLLDVATLGMTGGTGVMIGSAIGAGFGGKTAGDIARGEDADKVRGAQKQVNDELAAYGRAVDKAQSEADEAWTQELRDADIRAAQLAAIRSAQSDHLIELMRTDLERLRTLSAAEAKQLLAAAASTVDAAATHERSPRARRRQTAWRRESDAIQARLTDGANPGVREVLTLVTAAPEGGDAARSWLTDRLQRRTTVIAAADQLHTALLRRTLADRQNLAHVLNRAKATLQNNVVTALAAPIERVERQTAQLKEELVIGGHLSKEDAVRLGRDS